MKNIRIGNDVVAGTDAKGFSAYLDKVIVGSQVSFLFNCGENPLMDA